MSNQKISKEKKFKHLIGQNLRVIQKQFYLFLIIKKKTRTKPQIK